jgi:hypothetical protein
LRLDLGIDLPVAYARLNDLANPKNKPYWKHLRKKQENLRLRKSVMISVDGVEHQADRVHRTTAGYREEGVRWADGIYPLL